MRFINKQMSLLCVLITISITTTMCTNAMAVEGSSFNQTIYNVIEKEDTLQGQNTGQASNVRLQDDFYDSINGKWINQVESNVNSLLNEESSFTELQDKSDNDIRKIINDLVENKSNYNVDSDERKIINLYKNMFNFDQRNKQGTEPVKVYLNKIENVKSVSELTNLLSDKDIDIFNSLVKFSIKPTKDEKSYKVELVPTYLGLDDSDQYTNQTESGKSDREEYIKYLYNLLTLSGYSKEEAKTKIEQLITFEETIAPSILGSAEAEKINELDVSKYNVSVTLDQLNNKAPNINLPGMMKKLGIDKADNIVIQQDKWLTEINQLWTDENLPLLKNYLEMIVIQSTSKFLTEDMNNVNNDYTKYLAGQNSVDLSLQGYAYSMINNKFALKLGKLYVDKHFSDSDKKDIEDLTKEIISTYRKRILNTDWLSEETKKNVIDKLDKVTIDIGYPDYYNNNFNMYSGVDVKLYEDGGSLLSNVMNLLIASREKEIESLNKSIDKTMFSNTLSPQSLTAEYHFDNNSLIVTAGILQPDFYSRNETKEQKLATAGFVIAHEIGHAFDNTGIFFDADGNIKKCWAQDDYKKYLEKANAIISFYDNVEVFPGKNVNGKATLGENIADLSSMRCLLDIMQTMPNADYKLFFKSFAQGYKSVRTQEYEEYMLDHDTHSPYKVRVNEVLSQYEEFYKTYGIKEGDKMYIKPESRIGIWT